jgi:hypothetical protein
MFGLIPVSPFFIIMIFLENWGPCMILVNIQFKILVVYMMYIYATSLFEAKYNVANESNVTNVNNVL